MVNLNNKISILIEKEFRILGDKEFAKSRNRLIGEKAISYGVKTQEIRKIAKKYFKQFQERETKRDWLEIVKRLMSTKVFENQMMGIFLLGLFLKAGGKLSISELEKLITKYIDNWAICDAMSSEVVARTLKKLPEESRIIYIWPNSENIWLRRAILVALVKLKNKIENWQEIASKIISSFSKENEPIVKKSNTLARKKN